MALLEEIRGISSEAALQLEKVDCCTDRDIRLLTHNDLQELLPGLSNFKLRKKIYEAVHKKHPIQAVLNELKSFIPDEFLIDAFHSNGSLHDYLQMLKAVKSEVTHVQEFLDAHIDLLEKFSQKEDTKANEDEALISSVNHTPAVSPNVTKTNHSEYNLHSEKAQASPFMHNYSHHNYMAKATKPQLQATVRYKVSVSGNTLNRHMDLLEKIKSNNRDSLHLQEAKRDEDVQVTIVFCPVVSRAGTDVKTALSLIQDDKPIILVMMHHRHSGFVAPTGQRLDHNVVLVVNVFFHETVPGLVTCPQNDEAINKIQATLQSFSTNTGKRF
ncbi:uncharacterized protein LOC117392911 [Periophthalmus magnuspinnatus]|uniref:uncharacterized protein LOC117392911 n=1 Tax=Periophthalmus magnuspinnatus TaxID=409849 RepID=UPI00145A6C21|nr:uncharacterized protein LOC117392911 [Periophthalmus magnuspinnatus]